MKAWNWSVHSNDGPRSFDGSIEPTKETYDQFQQAYDVFEPERCSKANCPTALSRCNAASELRVFLRRPLRPQLTGW